MPVRIIPCKTIHKYIEAYENSSLNISEVIVLDNYLAGGYGLWNEGIKKTIFMMMEKNGIPLDTTYTGKAFWGMTEYLIREDKKIKMYYLYIQVEHHYFLIIFIPSNSY